jgi:hypothetical protein
MADIDHGLDLGQFAVVLAGHHLAGPALLEGLEVADGLLRRLGGAAEMTVGWRCRQGREGWQRRALRLSDAVMVRMKLLTIYGCVSRQLGQSARARVPGGGDAGDFVIGGSGA